MSMTKEELRPEEEGPIDGPGPGGEERDTERERKLQEQAWDHGMEIGYVRGRGRAAVVADEIRALLDRNPHRS